MYGWFSARSKTRSAVSFGGAETSGGNFFLQTVFVFFTQTSVHVGVDHAAGDRVDLDVAGGKFFANAIVRPLSPALAAE